MAWILLLGAAKLILAEMVVLYAILVAAVLRSEGPRYKLEFDPEAPERSAARLVVWLGVRTLAAVLGSLKASLDILEDISADVGEWVLHRRSY